MPSEIQSTTLTAGDPLRYDNKPIRMDPNATSPTIFLTMEGGRIQQIGMLEKGDRSKTPDHTIPLDRSKTYPGKTPEERARAELRDIRTRAEKYMTEHPDASVIRVEMSPAAYKLMAQTVNGRDTMGEQVDALNDLLGMPARERASTRDQSGGREVKGGERDRDDVKTPAPAAKSVTDSSREQPADTDGLRTKPNERPPAGARPERSRV
jgi:hypothetical protein